MTAEWENSLLQIGKKSYESNQFMKEIEEMILVIVKNYRADKETFKRLIEGGH